MTNTFPNVIFKCDTCEKGWQLEKKTMFPFLEMLQHHNNGVLRNSIHNSNAPVRHEILDPNCTKLLLR